MPSPKEAQRRKQAEKRLREEKKAEKKARKGGSLEATVVRWMQLDPSNFPLDRPCPECGEDMMLELSEERSILHHRRPWCPAYQAFSATLEGAEPLDGHDPSHSEILERMIPAWTEGPYTEISEEEGEELLESSEVLQSCELMGGGMIGSHAYARTAKGLFRWPVTDALDEDWDEDDDLDEDDFDEDVLA